MFKEKIQCVTDQTIRKLMYIRAGKYACLSGDIKRKELLEQAFVVEDVMFICIILSNTFPCLK